MKLHEAVFDALSDIDEKMLEHSERPQRGFALHWAQAAGLLVLVFCLVLIPNLRGTGMGAPASDAKDTEYAQAEEHVDNNTNWIITEELSELLEDGKTVPVRITVPQNDSQAYEALYEVLKEAGISAEITADGVLAELNRNDIERIAWPEEYALVFRAVREEK